MAGLLDLISTGGPVLIILAGLSLISVAVIVLKLLELMPVTAGQAARSNALATWRAGDMAKATDILGSAKSPAGQITHAAMVGLRDDQPRDVVEAEAERLGNLSVARMNRFIRLLELIAMIAPLLGLLGTVLGMIESFQELELAQGAANASVLAGGIWQALLTTAAGLIVAIPAAIGAALLSARIETAATLIETSVAELLAIHDTKRAA